jgi:hypothetical protein
MPQTLEWRVDETKAEQRRGLFKIPKEVIEHETIKTLIEERASLEDCPLVIEDEEYARSQVSEKLGMHPYRIRHLVRFGLIRPRDSKNFTKRKTASTLTIAQKISLLYGVEIQRANLTQGYLNSKAFQELPPRERVRILLKGYDKTEWLKDISARLRKRKLPRIRSWHNIRRTDLNRVLYGRDSKSACSNHAAKKLIQKGLTILKPPEFQSYGSNFIDNSALAELIAFLHEVDYEDVMIEDDCYFKRLVQSFLHRRLVPFLIENRFQPNSEITLKEAGRITEQRPYQLAIRMGVENPGEDRFWTHNTVIIASDLAIFMLRGTRRKGLTEAEIFELFGTAEFAPRQLGFFLSKRGAYAGYQYVYPLYDQVAEKAKETLDGSDPISLTPLSANGDTYYLTPMGKIRYCSTHDWPRFDEACIEHITENILRGNRRGTKIKGPSLEITAKGNIIQTIKLLPVGYKTPEN